VSRHRGGDFREPDAGAKILACFVLGVAITLQFQLRVDASTALLAMMP
jgi:hypothetical protein